MEFFLEDEDNWDPVDDELWYPMDDVLDTLIDYGKSEREVPTHTEDGIPIRKIYVTNLPNKITRKELFELFAQYGYIKSCWLKTKDHFTPYAFVTFTEPADAHKALTAGKLRARGRHLRVSPADSWHQPVSDAQGNVIWSTKKQIVPTPEDTSDEAPSDEAKASSSKEDEPAEGEREYNIMDILNRDCMMHVMSYLTVPDLIRTEAVSKRWKDIVQDYFLGFRKFKTSRFGDTNITLTTAVLRHILQRVGPMLTSLHIDDYGTSLNDRTAHTIGKFCPNLEHLTVEVMQTRNWNPLFYCCKNLQSVSFVSCDNINDLSLRSLMSPKSTIKSVTITKNHLVSGAFLDYGPPPQLRALVIDGCRNFDAHRLLRAAPKMNLQFLTLTRLHLQPSLSDILTQLLKPLATSPNTEQREVPSIQYALEPLTQLTELRALNLSGNNIVCDKFLEGVAASCTKLRVLNVAGDIRLSTKQITAKGLKALRQSAAELQELNISYLNLGDEMGELAGCPALRRLVVQGDPDLTDAALVQCLQTCHQLEELDVCGCMEVTEEVIIACISELEKRPRPMKLYLGGTGVDAQSYESLKHANLTVNMTNSSRTGCFGDIDGFFSDPDISDLFSDGESDDDFDIYDDYSVADSEDDMWYIDQL